MRIHIDKKGDVGFYWFVDNPPIPRDIDTSLAHPFPSKSMVMQERVLWILHEEPEAFRDCGLQFARQ